jgi:DNA-binding MarR family transcriptional regulator
LLEQLDQAQRQVGGQSVLLSESLAEQIGMHPSDLEALGFLFDEGAVPAGRLAEVTGLTTGAVTRMIDRLERSGYVRREPDPRDRRRVIVRLVPERLQELVAYYEPLTQAAHELYARYTDAELTLILDFLRRSYEVGVQETVRIRSAAPSAGTGRVAADEGSPTAR